MLYVFSKWWFFMCSVCNLIGGVCIDCMEIGCMLCFYVFCVLRKNFVMEFWDG